MGYKHDQSLFPETYRPPPESADLENPPPPTLRGPPPPLPPRVALDSLQDHHADAPPPYTETTSTYHSQPLTNSWTGQDPRSSSTQSLVPHNDPTTDGDGNRTDGKRTLLLVYIHGFMGNETSFQSFPAHVHNLVTVKLEGSHVVHTKIYPKYKSRKAIEFARDTFSDWLSPHEGPNTDVILLGHSMGGLLSAEVTLLEGHRILGTINFDTPFLGMHPGVIASGLGSLFRPAPDSPGPKSAGIPAGSQDVARTSTNEGIESSASSSYFGSEITGSTLMPTESSSTTTIPLSTALDLPTKDPNFDPPFVNDVRLPQRSGWSNAWHFLNKHSDDLRKATQSYVKSHLEFGGAMADYNGLRKRYGKIRALENGKPPERTRFLNYYTASTGRPKKPKEPSLLTSGAQTGQLDGDSSQVALQVHEATSDTLDDHSQDLSPRISIEKVDDEDTTKEDAQDDDRAFITASGCTTDDESAVSDASQAIDHLYPAPITDDEREEFDEQDKPAALKHVKSEGTLDSMPSKAPSIASTHPPPSRAAPSLPPIPFSPEEPAPFDATLYTDEDIRKLAEKEHSRQVKAYKQAVKDRDKAIADRRKLVEKREKNAAKEREKLEKAEEKERIKTEQRGMEKGERERAKAEREERKKSEKERLKGEKEKGKAESDKLKNVSLSESAPEPDSEVDAGADSKEEKAKRDKKFCMLPWKGKGPRDPCWVRVFMPGVDEVGAHCGLFFVDGERYQWFVDDVAKRIEDWVTERGEERQTDRLR